MNDDPLDYNVSPTYIGLYYPHIKFKSDNWLKLSALYWDRMARIVPAGYEPRDSDTVRTLADGLDFIVNVRPSHHDVQAVGARFIELVQKQGQDLARAYGVSLHHRPPDSANANTVLSEMYWDDVKPPRPAPPQSPIAYTHARDKMWDRLADLLVSKGLGREETIGLHRLLGVHPRLAFVYMQGLAIQMATARRFFPLTDEVVSHVVSSYSVTEAVEMMMHLIPVIDIQAQTGAGAAEGVGTQFLMLALECAIPQDLEHVHADRIVLLRRRRADEFVAFQQYLSRLCAAVQQLADVVDEGALRSHLEVLYDRRIRQAIEDLKRCMREQGVETATGVLQVRVAMPALAASIVSAAGYNLTHLSPLFVAGGALVCSLIPYLASRRRAARRTFSQSPVAFLMLAERELRPSRITTLVNRTYRRLVLASGGSQSTPTSTIDSIRRTLRQRIESRSTRSK